MKDIFAAAVVVGGLAGFVGPAEAQYYREPPQPDYYPQREFEREPPPPGYYPQREFEQEQPPPGYYRQREVVPFGRRCEAFLRTQAGPRRLVCRIIRAKPLGEECACPPPPPPPGYPEGPYVGGRTIR